jgi:opacity protein-like surface antigen
MKNEIQAAIIISFAGTGVAFSQAQYIYLFPEGAGPYAQVDAGPSFYQSGELKTFGGPASGSVHYRVGGMADAQVGYAFNQYVATGFEFGVNGTTIDSIPNYSLSDARFYNVPFLANVTFSYPIPHTILTPYIGGGAGGSDSVFNPGTMQSDTPPNYNYVTGSEDDVVFAWEAYAGLRFQLAQNMTLGIGYKYFATGNPDFSYPPSPNFNVGFRGVETHSITVTFNVSFW